LSPTPWSTTAAAARGQQGNGCHRRRRVERHPLPEGGRSGTPPARDCRVGHRRSEERPDRPFAVSVVGRELRVAGPGRGRVQPDPARRLRGLGLSRQSDHGHDPPAAAHRPAPNRAFHTPPEPATPRQAGHRPKPGSSCAPPRPGHPSLPDPSIPTGDERRNAGHSGRTAATTAGTSISKIN
jgi:hypothetical protein